MEQATHTLADIARELTEIKRRGRDIPTITPMETKYDCPICKDKLFVIVKKDDDDEGERATCSCQLRRWRQVSLKRSGVPEDRRDETFATFEHLPGTKEAFEAAKALAAGELKLVILSGNTGTGKTRLAISCILDRCQQAKSAMIIRAADWLDDLKDAFGYDKENHTVSANVMLNQVKAVSLLVIDELKWRTNFDEETLDNLITRRIEAGKQTIITANVSISELQRTYPRIVSRASDKRFGAALWMKAKDYRVGVGR